MHFVKISTLFKELKIKYIMQIYPDIQITAYNTLINYKSFIKLFIVILNILLYNMAD